MALSYRQILYADTVSELPMSSKKGDLAYVDDVNLYYKFDGSQWILTERVVVKKGLSTVNGLIAGNTLVYTLENTTGMTFVPLFIHVEAINMSGVITPPTVSVGTNAPNYNNILNLTAMDSILNTTGLIKTYNVSSAIGVPSIPPGTAIYTRVGGLAIATTYAFRIDIIGYYNRLT
jgi:hypothetical protein